MTAMEWRAQWIWGAANGIETARYFYFRHAFTLPEREITSCVVRVCADTRYRLWFNGRHIGHGPARSLPALQYFDTYDLTKYVRPGRNAFAALVTHYGIGTCYACLGAPGFLLQADVTMADGQTVTIATDGEWRCAPAPYGMGYRRMSIQLAYPEEFDATREPVNWNLIDFQDDEWQPAHVLGSVGIEPWMTLIPRDIPLPRYNTIAPIALIQRNAVEKSDVPIGRPENDEGLVPATTPAFGMAQATRLRPAPPGSVTCNHPALFTVAPQSGNTGVSVVLDFGREVSGFPLVMIRRGKGGRVDIGYSERIESDGTVTPHHLVNDVQYADRLLLRPGGSTLRAAGSPGHQHYEPLDHRAFRYMRLDFYDCPEPVEMLVELRESGYPVKNRGEFQCSDPLLQRIWEVGRYTTQLCMDDGFMDCPWRERGQWLGDAHVEMLVAAYAFGDTQLARKALLQFPQSQNEAGWFKGVFPSDTDFDAILPTFCFLWPVALWDYFLLTGEVSLLQAVWPNLERLIAAITRHTDDDGLVADLPGWVFVDWAKLNTGGQCTAVNAQAYDALQAAARIARTLGLPEQGEKLNALATGLKEAVNDLLWDRERQFYIEGIVKGERSTVITEQANVLCAMTGIADARQTARIVNHLLRPESGDVIPIATPYFDFYLQRLRYQQGRYEEALASIREKWGRMLDAGATTFWEQWEPHWSLCHAWSAAPTYDLLAEHAGIRPTAPGFEEFEVRLRPCHLTWLRATVPTPRGDIAVHYARRPESDLTLPTGERILTGPKSPAITVNLTIPNGTRAQVRIPLLANRGKDVGSLETPTVRFNGKPAWEAGKPVSAMGDKFTREGDDLLFGVIGGHYQIEIER